MKSATTTLIALLLTVAGSHTHADPDGTVDGPAVITRSPVELPGEMNETSGADLPASASCSANCVEPAILGDRLVVLGRDLNGVPFVAAPTDHRGNWTPADRVRANGLFPVLDDWFLGRVDRSRGVAALDGTPVGYAVADDGGLTLDLALPPGKGRSGLTQDSRPGNCPSYSSGHSLFYGTSHQHEFFAYCTCYGQENCNGEENASYTYTYIKVIETDDCMGVIIGVSYETNDASINCNSECPCPIL